ncbi:MAG: hypothetical protein LBG47_05490 [Prevotellaceae bacterium]|nr:hypothetical protein [Prevotellaceae bacterium]
MLVVDALFNSLFFQDYVEINLNSMTHEKNIFNLPVAIRHRHERFCTGETERGCRNAGATRRSAERRKGERLGMQNKRGLQAATSCLRPQSDENVGAMLWGLTQTDLPWGCRPEKLPYTGEWQHDLFRNDFTPYRESELALIKKLNGK